MTTVSTTAGFGRWPSPLSARQAAAGKVSLTDLCSDGHALYWLESRPSDGGRTVFVRAVGDEVHDLSPIGVSVRSRVHEYGGGAVCLLPGHGDSAFAYVALADQRVWCMERAGAAPVALCASPPPGEVWNHGGLTASADGDWVLAVREIHDQPEPGNDQAEVKGPVPTPRRMVVALGTRADNAGESVIFAGHDFYGAPRMDASGARVAVVAWDHPDMPWDYSTLEVVAICRVHADDENTSGARGAARLAVDGAVWSAAGGQGSAGSGESVGQPMWGRDGSLLFVSDRAGWWQPYRRRAMVGGEPVALTDVAAEFHGADFVLGLSTMVERADGSLVARMSSEGFDRLVVIPPGAAGGAPLVMEQPCVTISAVCAHGDAVACIGATAYGPAGVLVVAPELPLAERGAPTPARSAVRQVGSARPAPLPESAVSPGQPFSFAGGTGGMVHGIFFPPVFPSVPHEEETIDPAGEHPPLIVHCHSGPTSSASAAFDMTVQYFTSRGFAVALVDYAGSTGFGRAYRCSLWGRWGEADAVDCAEAARHLAAGGLVHPERMAVRGSSAGGLTALNALTVPGTFAAAVSWYGVTDLLSLAASTHDFEAHYMDRLVGPLPGSRATYEARSPVNRADELRGSVLLFQGLDDLVVPPSQAERLRSALGSRGAHCEVHFFEGEGHGFRRAETLQACLEEELDFYLRELGL